MHFVSVFSEFPERREKGIQNFRVRLLCTSEERLVIPFTYYAIERENKDHTNEYIL